MFGISSTELMIIVIFGFLLFGPDKLPQMGRTIGRALRQFRETQEKMTSVVQSEVIDPMAAAAAAPVKPKKAHGSSQGAAADDDLDADRSDATEVAPRRKETFAERRARLAAEKAEKEAAAAESDAEAAVVAGSDQAASTAAQPAADGSRAEGAEPAPEPEQPVVRTTEDLYARRPRKRKAAVDERAEDVAPAADASAEDVAPAADASAGDAASDVAAVEGGEQ